MLIQRKYRLLFFPKRVRRPGPKGPTKELVDAVIEMKRRNHTWGCKRIAEQIAFAFGVEIDKDVVRRILATHFHPESGSGGPSWLSFIGNAKDSLWSLDLFRCESGNITNPLGFGGDGSIYATDRGLCRSPRSGRWTGIVPDVQSGSSRTALPKHLSSDHDPGYRFHQWQANLRVLMVQEIKTVPYAPLSHPFVERLIGSFVVDNKTAVLLRFPLCGAGARAAHQL